MAKKLMINCGTCDARSVSEETLKSYEHIMINAGSVVVTPESKNLMNGYGVTINCGDVIELDRDVQLNSVNGSMQINSTDQVPEKRIFLALNGSLEIGPDTQDILAKYEAIHVNGSVTYPQSMSGKTPLKVNGDTICYPDDAIVLKRSAVIDRLFALRAKARTYWAAKRLIMVDPQLDGETLAAKGATFSAGEAVIAESKVESVIDLIDEKTEITIVPDGTQVVLDDLELNTMAGKKYGSRLCVFGDLEIPETGKQTLEQLEYLNVQGDVRVQGGLEDLLARKLTVLKGKVQVIRGRYLKDKLFLRISREMLEQEPEGLTICDCVQVNLDHNIPGTLIQEKLQLDSCVKVHCTPEQEPAVSLVCQDVVQISTQSEGEESGIGGMVNHVLGTAGETADTRFVSAGDYVL